MTHPAPPKRASLYPTRGAAGALLGQQLAARGYIGCLLLGITPEGVEIAANAAKAMGAQLDVLVAAFIKLGSNLAPIGAIAESVPSEMDPDFQPSGALLDKLASAIDESRARVSQDLILYRTQRPVKTLAGKVAVIVDGQVVYPWKVLAAAKAAEQLGAKQVVIATPVATQTAADRIRARSYEVVCPSVVVETSGHPAPYGDMTGEPPERLRSIMIAHQAAEANRLLDLPHALPQPTMLAPQHVLGDLIPCRIGVPPQLLELTLDASARLATEQIRERHGPLPCGGVLPEQPPRPRAGRGHREQLRAHVHEAEQHGLAVFELGAEPHHGVEHATREPAGVTVDVAHVLSQWAERRVLRPEAPAEPA